MADGTPHGLRLTRRVGAKGQPTWTPVVIALVTIALVTFSGIAEVRASQQTDVEAAIAAWTDAFATMDGTKSAALYSADARLWGTIATEQAAGHDAIRAYFDSGRQRARARHVVIGDHATRVYGTTAVSSGHYTFHSVLLDGSPSVRRARFSMTFVRQNGRWLIVDHHSSDVPAAP